jgi:hypothetical protein
VDNTYKMCVCGLRGNEKQLRLGCKRFRKLLTSGSEMMTKDLKKVHKRLLIPGPTEVSPKILNEQARPVISHRSREFTALYTGIIEKLHTFLQLSPDFHTTVTSSSGSLWFDIVGRSIVRQKALVCVNGAFSQRFAETLRSCGKQTDVLEVEWGKAVKPEMIAEKLESGGYDTVGVCQMSRLRVCGAQFTKSGNSFGKTILKLCWQSTLFPQWVATRFCPQKSTAT